MIPTGQIGCIASQLWRLADGDGPQDDAAWVLALRQSAAYFLRFAREIEVEAEAADEVRTELAGGEEARSAPTLNDDHSNGDDGSPMIDRVEADRLDAAFQRALREAIEAARRSIQYRYEWAPGGKQLGEKEGVHYAETVHYRAIYDVLQGQWSLSVTLDELVSRARFAMGARRR
jgi:hypothetical protein